MAKSDFIPPQDGPFLDWHDQFKTAATAIGVTLGFNPGDLTKITNDNTAVHAKVTVASAAANAAKTATADKLAARRTAENNARLYARRVKSHANYTPVLGQQLGIIGPEDTTDLTTAKPKLAGRALPHGVVELQFNKSKADGVNLYSKRGDEADYAFLARDTASPYVDNRSLLVSGKPEVRQYKAVYVLDDAEIGIASEPVDITCEP